MTERQKDAWAVVLFPVLCVVTLLGGWLVLRLMVH
jgi:hypothetical protein